MGELRIISAMGDVSFFCRRRAVPAAAGEAVLQPDSPITELGLALVLPADRIASTSMEGASADAAAAAAAPEAYLWP